MAKQTNKKKKLPQKLREETISLHHKGDGYKQISKTLQVPRDTAGIIMCKLKTPATAANLPGRGRKQKFIKCLNTTAEKNSCVTAKDLQEDLTRAGAKG